MAISLALQANTRSEPIVWSAYRTKILGSTNVSFIPAWNYKSGEAVGLSHFQKDDKRNEVRGYNRYSATGNSHVCNFSTNQTQESITS